jgi:hypothetical protein
MCFSATVSFGASAVLAAGGVAAIKKASSKEQYLFAMIPFIFSVQQLAEGILWMSFSHYQFENFRFISTLIFIIVADVIWPVWVPFSILRMEKKAARKKILKIFLWTGITFSAYITWCLFNYPYMAYPESHHIKYDLDFPLNGSYLASLFYFVPTVLSCIVSSRKKMPALGLVIFGSYILTRIFFAGFSISVWCFFAALISLMIIYVLHLAGLPSPKRFVSRGRHAMEG